MMPPTYSTNGAASFGAWLQQAGALLDIPEGRERLRAALPSIGMAIENAASLEAFFLEHAVEDAPEEARVWFCRAVVCAARDVCYRYGVDPDVVPHKVAIDEHLAAIEAEDPEDD